MEKLKPKGPNLKNKFQVLFDGTFLIFFFIKKQVGLVIKPFYIISLMNPLTEKKITFHGTSKILARVPNK